MSSPSKSASPLPPRADDLCNRRPGVERRLAWPRWFLQRQREDAARRILDQCGRVHARGEPDRRTALDPGAINRDRSRPGPSVGARDDDVDVDVRSRGTL